jgi:hypothetical protein
LGRWCQNQREIGRGNQQEGRNCAQIFRSGQFSSIVVSHPDMLTLSAWYFAVSISVHRPCNDACLGQNTWDQRNRNPRTSCQPDVWREEGLGQSLWRARWSSNPRSLVRNIHAFFLLASSARITGCRAGSFKYFLGHIAR